MNDKIITLEKVSKLFQLPHERKQTLKQHFFGLFQQTKSEPFYAVRDLNLTVQRGECVGIVGRNGSGKSTLLRLIGGIYQPTTGRVTVRGKIAPFIEVGVGFHGDLSGRENIYLYGTILGLSRQQIRDKFAQIVAFSELERFLDQKLKHYSSGMQVRLAFSILTHVDADILLIDEALAVGDAPFQQKCLLKIAEFQQQQKTILFVSHDQKLVEQTCTRVIRM